MLKNTFCHLTGIGLKREKLFWSSGITSWDFLSQSKRIPFSRAKMMMIEKEIAQSFINLENNIPRYFTDKLCSTEHWRLISEFYHSVAYLDIETTGLSNSFDHITTIALYDGNSIFYYIMTFGYTNKCLHLNDTE